MPSFSERLRAIEEQLRRKPGAGTFTILEISGCLPGPVNHASAGAYSWDRAEGEDYAAFVRRAADAALEAGQMALVVGGLIGREQTEKYWLSDTEFDFEAWWQAEAAPYYSEYPPEEKPGFVRQGPKW